MVKRFMALTVLAIVLMTTPAMAKEGVYLGVDLAYNNIVGSDEFFDTVDGAFGLGLKVGYNFGQFALEGELIGSSHNDDIPEVDDGDFSGFSINFKPYVTQPNDPNQFYFLIGLGAYKFEQTVFSTSRNYEFTGGGLNLGAGWEHFINDRVALNVSGIYRFINYGDVEINGVEEDFGDVDGDVFSLNLGLNFYF